MQGLWAYSRYEKQPGNKIFLFPDLQVFLIPVFNSETLSVALVSIELFLCIYQRAIEKMNIRYRKRCAKWTTLHQD